jgi:hypothetical protein
LKLRRKKLNEKESKWLANAVARARESLEKELSKAVNKALVEFDERVSDEKKHPVWYLCWDDGGNFYALNTLASLDEIRSEGQDYDHVEPVTAENLARFLPKPATRYDWSKAPEWAQWAARDFSGKAYWYDQEPFMGRANEWFVATLCWRRTEDKDILDSCGDWRDSLERRPE